MKKLIESLDDRARREFVTAVLAIALLATLMLTGCSGSRAEVATNSAGDISGGFTGPLGTNADWTVTGSGNPQTGEWQAGLAITFKTVPPADVQDALRAAGAVPAKGTLTWIIANADAAKKSVQDAIIASLEAGGTVVSIRKP